jgi:DNA-binding helix-hairpin-helix protein with protein kinase domain
MISSTEPRPFLAREGSVVHTISGRALTLQGVLGRGGQGAVFRTDDAGRAVKVRWSGVHAAAWRRRIERCAFLERESFAYPGLRRFVLPRELLAEPWLGYEMPLLPGAEPVSALIHLPRERPEEWYVATGGLRRRLGIAVRVARAMNALHSAGFVFGDLSANNVLTASDPQRSSIRVIDCDNVDIAGSEGAGILGTPGYWAPERVTRNVPPDAAADDHSLAVLVHELVYLTHPLRGALAFSNEDPDAAEARVDRGEVPWVFEQAPPSHLPHTNDPLGGLPPALAAAEDTTLFARFRDAFGAGLHDRTRRPTAATLQNAVEKLLCLCMTCRACGATQVYPKQRECLWCGGVLPPPLLLVIEPDERAPEFRPMREARAVVEMVRALPEMQRVRNEGREPPAPQKYRFRNYVIEDGLVLTDALLRPWRASAADEIPLARFQLDGQRLLLRAERESGIRHNGRDIAPGSTVTVTAADMLTVPGDHGEPSCHLRVTRPRREEP